MSRPRFWVELFRGPRGSWLHRTKAANGKTVQVSETYSSMRKAVASATSLANAAHFELRYVSPKGREERRGPAPRT